MVTGERVRREDLTIFAGLAVLIAVGGFTMQTVQDYLNGDWGEVQECRETYWTCEAEVAGKSKIPRTRPVTFKADAKACDEYRSYEVSLRRATFDCAMSRGVVGGTCREVETRCELPKKRY